MRISDWSSDVCSSDLEDAKKRLRADRPDFLHDGSNRGAEKASRFAGSASSSREPKSRVLSPIVAFSKASCKNGARKKPDPVRQAAQREGSQAAFLLSSIRSEEHKSELQALMRISYAVFCWNKKNIIHRNSL